MNCQKMGRLFGSVKQGETYVVKKGFWSAEDKCWCDGDFGFHLVDQPIAWMEIDIPHPYEGSENAEIH